MSIDTRNTASLREKQIRINNMIYLETRLLKNSHKRYSYRFFGNARPGGAQVFPGYRPENEVSKGRNSVAAYLDAELEATDWLFLEGALRYENYTDFGSTFNYKLASNIRISKV